MKVQDLMTESVATCHEGDSLDSAAGTMWDYDCGALPVLGEDDTIVGMITDRDICMAAYNQGQPLDEMVVGDVSDGEVFSVSPQDSIEQAEELMRRHQVRRVPVVDYANQVVGILSLNDLAREGKREIEEGRQEIDSQEIVQTLAAICEPAQQYAT